MPGSAWRASIGWIRPGTVDRLALDFFRMTPPDVNLVVYTTMWSLKMLHAGTFDIEGFRAMRGEILQTVQRVVAYQDPDYIVLSGDLIQAAMGPVWDLEMRHAVEEVSGKPATTAMTALVDALSSLGVSKVAVATPFRDDQNEHIRRYLSEAGFVVTALLGQPTQSPNAIRALDPATPYEMGKRAVLAAPGAQALYLPCPIWPGVTDAIARLEAELDLPVLTVFNPVLWKALVTLGYDAPVRGFGRLLEHGVTAARGRGGGRSG